MPPKKKYSERNKATRPQRTKQLDAFEKVTKRRGRLARMEDHMSSIVEDVASQKKTPSQKIEDYCWLCHKEWPKNELNDHRCQKCYRVFHHSCLGPSHRFTEDGKNCPECRLKTVDGTVLEEYIPAKELKILLERLLDCLTERYPEFQTWPFHPGYGDKTIDVSDFKDFDIIEDKLRNKDTPPVEKRKSYRTTAEFLADIKQIFHNCSIVYGNQHAITTKAKNLVKSCREELIDLEACSECFQHSLTASDSSVEDNGTRITADNVFTMVCKIPHSIVWVKMRGYPYWPSKVLKVIDAKANVRFFGTHDKGKVPICDCLAISEASPNHQMRFKKDYDAAVAEFKVYVHNYEKSHGSFTYAPKMTLYDPGQLSFSTKKATKHALPMSSQTSAPKAKRGRPGRRRKTQELEPNLDMPNPDPDPDPAQENDSILSQTVEDKVDDDSDKAIDDDTEKTADDAEKAANDAEKAANDVDKAPDDDVDNIINHTSDDMLSSDESDDIRIVYESRGHIAKAYLNNVHVNSELEPVVSSPNHVQMEFVVDPDEAVVDDGTGEPLQNLIQDLQTDRALSDDTVTQSVVSDLVNKIPEADGGTTDSMLNAIDVGTGTSNSFEYANVESTQTEALHDTASNPPISIGKYVNKMVSLIECTLTELYNDMITQSNLHEGLEKAKLLRKIKELEKIHSTSLKTTRQVQRNATMITKRLTEEREAASHSVKAMQEELNAMKMQNETLKKQIESSHLELKEIHQKEIEKQLLELETKLEKEKELAFQNAKNGFIQENEQRISQTIAGVRKGLEADMALKIDEAKNSQWASTPTILTNGILDSAVKDKLQSQAMFATSNHQIFAIPMQQTIQAPVIPKGNDFATFGSTMQSTDVLPSQKPVPVQESLQNDATV